MRPSPSLQEAVIEGLFLIMGRGLEAVDSIPAGNVCGILGLGQHILKAATLTNTRAAWPMASMMFQVSRHPFASDTSLLDGVQREGHGCDTVSRGCFS